MRTAFLLLCCGPILLAESAAGLRWTAPAGWNSKGTAPMRAASYDVPPAAGDKGPVECVVYFFGAGQGGPVDLNIARWKSQFLAANGKEAEAKVGKRVVHGLNVTTIDSSGSYTGMGGPAGGAPAVPGYRLLGAILEGPGGNIFIKFTGPAKTMAANQQKFEMLVASFDKDQKK